MMGDSEDKQKEVVEDLEVTLQREIAELGRRAAAVPAGKAGKKTRNKINKRLKECQAELVALDGNFSQSHAPGCHIAHLDASWLIGCEDLDEAFPDQDFDSLPEISLDRVTGMLSVINVESSLLKVFNISVGGACLPARQESGVQGQDGTILAAGTTSNSEGKSSACLSFILVVRPLTCMDVCYLSAMPDKHACQAVLEHDDTSLGYLVSDIQTLDPGEHDASSQMVATGGGADDSTIHIVLDFPLYGGPFLCSQGVGGRLTHFFPSNFHAVDFICPPGTPVLAVADGIVREVRQHEKVEGILATNLFQWNSILLELDINLFVEYVHIAHESATIAVGDRVSRGQEICKSGSVGFSPMPHLHFQVTQSARNQATTIPFMLRCKVISEPFLTRQANVQPVCGKWYAQND